MNIAKTKKTYKRKWKINKLRKERKKNPKADTYLSSNKH